MDSFLQVFQVGLQVLGESWQLVILTLLVIFISQSLMYHLLRWMFGDQVQGAEYLSLALAGWLLAATVLSILWYAVRTFIGTGFNGVVLLFLFGIPAFLFYIRVHRPAPVGSLATVIGLLTAAVLSIPLRLAFLSGLLLPMYFDSTRHYTIIESLLGGLTSGAADLSRTSDYYHVGFHFLTAWITSMGGVNIAQGILVVGQLILVIAPLGVFFLVRHATQSNSAAMFAVLLAAYGWSMPAYALNWGKYPAVTSLALLPFALSMAYLAAQSRETLSRHKKQTLYITLAIAMMLCTFLHSRSLIALMIAVVAWMLAGWWQSLPMLPRRILCAVLVLGIFLVGSFLQRQDVFEPLFQPYLSQGMFTTILVGILALFAFSVYPRWTFANLASILFLLGALFVVTPDWIPRLADRTLLDRPFVEMLLYLPLSLLGGFGIAGLTKMVQHTLRDRSLDREWRVQILSVVPLLFLFGHVFMTYDFYPSECCSIIGQDDMEAMQWIRNNVPDHARILIAVDELTLSSSDKSEGYAPADAGGWITPLTGRITVPLQYDTNLDKDPKFKSVCEMGIDYIYIGGVGLSFHAPRIRSNPDWYTPVLSISRVEVYQVVGCH